MEFDSVTGNHGKLDEKQNVNVIFVPESILLAFSKSAESSNGTDKAVVWSAQDGTVDSETNGLSSESNENDNFLVLDPGEWFVDTNLSNAEDGIVVLPKLKGSNPSTDASISDNSTESTSKLQETNGSTNISRKGVTENLEKEHCAEPKPSKCSVQADQANSNSKFKCTALNCSKTFKTTEEVSVHVKTHGKSNAHPCPFPGCSWSFPTPYKLRRHAESHKQSKSFKCTFPGCNVSCSTKYNLKVHAKFHEEEGFHRCKHCPASFRSKMKLTKHLRTVHEAQPMYQCPFPKCDKKFHTIAAQKVHEKWHRKERFICGADGCGKQFSLHGVFRQHYLCVHSGVRPFKCDYPGCKWEFATNAKLKRHAMTHTDAKKYVCPVPDCHSRFYRKEHLKSHSRVHRPDNNKKQDLSEKPIQLDLEGWVYYFCPYEDCGSLFSTLTGAEQHIIKAHNVSRRDERSNKKPCPKETEPERCLAPGNQIPVEIVATDVAINQCEIPARSCSQAVTGTQSILQTLMEAEPNTELATNETINTAPFQATLSTPCGNLNFISTNSQPLSVAILPESTTTQTMSSPTTMSTIDPSQFLLDSAGGFVPGAVSSNEAQSRDPETMKFFNLQQPIYSSPSAIPDGFLTYNDCVQTVDPNAVMSLRSPASSFYRTAVTLSSPCDISDDDNVGPVSCMNGSGSARTNYIPYKRRRITSKSSPVKIQEGRSGEIRGTRFYGFDGTPLSFTEKTPDHLNAGNDKDFTGSTINLSDLA